jgi:hypothetical protein
VDWRSSPRGQDLRPAIVIKDKKGEILKLPRGGEARYLLSVDAILSVEPGSSVTSGDVLARIPLESAKTRDITGGLPRVAELFEARRPKDHAIIAEISGRVEFGRDYKNKRRIRIVPEDDTMEPAEYLIPKGKHLPVQEGDYIEKGEYILDGHPAPHDILAIKGVEELATYLVNEVQEVYRLQGVSINDKHIEVIVRQMLQKVEITDAGTTSLLSVSRSTVPSLTRSTPRSRPMAARRHPVFRFCSASPRPACRRARSFPPRRSRRPPAFSPKPPFPARWTRSKASRKTSSSAASFRPVPAACWPASSRLPTSATA